MTQIPFDLSGAIGLSEATKLMRGKGGKAPSVDTIRRWANPRRGCYPAGKNGPRLILETRKVNGEILLMPEWVQAFEAQRAELGAREVVPVPSCARTTRQRQREQAAAERRLDAEGVR